MATHGLVSQTTCQGHPTTKQVCIHSWTFFFPGVKVVCLGILGNELGERKKKLREPLLKFVVHAVRSGRSLGARGTGEQGLTAGPRCRALLPYPELDQDCLQQ